jgi:hypothetical protein
MCEFHFFNSLPRALKKHSAQNSLTRAKGGLSAHLTAGPTAVTAVPLCREVQAVPRACFCNSRHSASVS